jgi:hypothetical protein
LMEIWLADGPQEVERYNDAEGAALLIPKNINV